MTTIRYSACLLLALPALFCGVGAARAQGYSGGGIVQSGGFQPPVKSGVVHPKGQTAPPVGIPGAQPQAAIAPPTRPALDMSPNDALFDAINRGDMAAARDALSRGAELSAQNVLGMTPLEESVDLGRNDITFLLLSMRGADAEARRGPTAPGAAPALATAAQPAGHAAKPIRLAAASARLSGSVHAVRPPIDAASPPGLAPATVRYSGSQPGDPVPQAGFLGFGAP